MRCAVFVALIVLFACGAERERRPPTGNSGDSGAGAADGAVADAADPDSGVNGDEHTQSCTRFINCVRDVEPGQATGASATYGPEGACWMSEPRDVCGRACQMAFEGLHQLHTDSAACGLCNNDNECSGGCNTTIHECVACTGDQHCSAPNPACDTGSNTCVRCNEDSHCSAPSPGCNVAAHSCVQCTRDEHCDSSRPGCNRSTFSCVECTMGAHCPSGRCEADQRCCRPRVSCRPGQCGTVDNGCGGTLNCPGCALGTCDSGECSNLLLPCDNARNGCAPNACLYDRDQQSYFCAGTSAEGNACQVLNNNCLRGENNYRYFHQCGFGDECRRMCLVNTDCVSGETCMPYFDFTITAVDPGLCR